MLGVEVSSVSWLGQLTKFKSLIILIVGFRNIFCCLAWASIILITYFSTVVPLTGQMKLQDPLKMSLELRKAYRKENTTCEWEDGGKIGN